MLTVADIGHHQGTIDWNLFAPAIDAVSIKAGGGDGREVPLYEDSQFRRNRDAVRRRALPRWYCYFAGCRTSGRREADHFLSQVPDVADEDALALDYEPAVPPPDPASWCAEFIDRVKRVTGKACLFCTNEDRVLTGDGQPVVDTCGGLWVAKYGKNDGFPDTPPKTRQWPRAAAWQYTSEKQMSGVTENSIDMNQFCGDKARRVGGITSWERYLQVLLDATRNN